VAHLDFAADPWHDCAAKPLEQCPEKRKPPLTRFIKQTLAALALTALVVPSQTAAQAKETVKATHGDWDIRCSESDEKLCVMVQVGKTPDGKDSLEIRIRKLTDAKTKDGKPIPAAIQIITPLATILRAGVRLTIDASEPRAAPYEVCVPTGCVVRDVMSEDFLNALKSGNSASVTYTMLQRGDIVSSVSLKGFTKAFGAL
jgi:invasion protein IalB